MSGLKAAAEEKTLSKRPLLRPAAFPGRVLALKPLDHRAPERLRGDPGAIFAWTLRICCWRKGDVRALAEALGVTRQSLWIWRKKGLPDDAKLLARIEAALESPATPLKLPWNFGLRDLVRAEEKGLKRLEGEGKEGNEALLDLLDRIVASPDPRFGRAFLPRLLEEMVFPEDPERRRSPALLYRWAWGSGVPETHLRRFAQAAIALELPDLLGLTPQAFEEEILPALRDRRRSCKTT